MNLKPYKPCPIEGYDVALTSRKKLAHVRKALADAKEAKRYWPFAEWSTLLADLEHQEADLAAEIKRTDEATFGKVFPRLEFVNCKNGLTAKSIVWLPNEDLDMPHIGEAVWTSLKRLVNCTDPDGDGIEVYADYDVYVARYSTPIHVIPRFE